MFSKSVKVMEDKEEWHGDYHNSDSLRFLKKTSVPSGGLAGSLVEKTLPQVVVIHMFF